MCTSPQNGAAIRKNFPLGNASNFSTGSIGLYQHHPVRATLHCNKPSVQSFGLDRILQCREIRMKRLRLVWLALACLAVVGSPGAANAASRVGEAHPLARGDAQFAFVDSSLVVAPVARSNPLA